MNDNIELPITFFVDFWHLIVILSILKNIIVLLTITIKQLVFDKIKLLELVLVVC